MASNYYVNGNTLVTADGSELGLSEGSVTIAIQPKHLDIKVSTFADVPPELQAMLAEATISMVLVYFDPAIVETVLRKSMAAGTLGQMPVAGTLMGANGFFTSLQISSPTGGRPWTFPGAFLTGNPVSWPLGNERTLLQMNFRAIPYSSDPHTAAGAVLFSRA